MTKLKRRNFLHFTVGFSGLPLAGCGGGGEPETVSGGVSEQPLASPGPGALKATPLAVQPPASAPVGAMQFTLYSPTAQTAPFCLGYAFRRGDIPAGSTVASDHGSLQVTPKNHWPDGSLKFAQLAGLADLPAGGLVVTLRRVAAGAAGVALTTADLKRTGITAGVGCGALGSVAWSGADWDAPVQSWIAGPEMSSWVYRKAVGSDRHLVAWLEVRLFASGAVEVLPWVENGFLRVPSPTNKNAAYTFTLGNSQRFSETIDLKHHQRTPLISGAALSYWLASDPGVVPWHDPLYLQATELVPSYRSTVAADAGIVANLPATYTPLAKGSFLYDGGSASMAASGYQPAIGLLPEHDMLYLAVRTPSTAYAAVVRNGYYAGQFGIHYRDEATHRPPRFSQWPTLVIAESQGIKDSGASTTGTYTAAATGGNGAGWDIAHSPSVGYMAYLLTGRFYFMEEVQFAATLNAFQMTDWVRGGGTVNYAPRSGYSGASMICLTAVDAIQTRSAAWGFRTLAQALCVTPDTGDPLRAEFLAAVEDNCRYFHEVYVAQPNNPFGWIKPGESYEGSIRKGAAWQQDFVTAAWGYAKSMGLPLSSTGARKMDEFFAWKARSVIRRLGVSSEFWYVNANAYTAVITPSATPDYDGGTGPWLASDAAVYAATNSPPPSPDHRSSTEGVLGFDFGAAVDAVRGMWGNLQPAIAYAVRHGVPGAVPAYNRMVGASNWPALRDAFVSRPVWGVMPAQALPAWLVGQAVNEWFEIPGTAGAGGSAVDAYSGFALDDRNGEIVIAAAGGHNDSYDNRVVSLGLLADAPSWTLRKGSSVSPVINVPHYPDGLPSSRHLYHSAHVVESLNRVFLFGAYGAYGSGWGFPTVDAFHLGTNQWDPAGTWASVPAGGAYGAVKVRATGDVYTSTFFKWTAATQAWSQPVTVKTNDLVRFPVAHDSRRNQLFSLMWGDGQGYDPGLNATRVPLSGNRQYSVRFNASSALAQFQADAPAYAGMDYDPDADRFLFYCGQGAGSGRIYVIKPNDTDVWDMSILPLGPGSVTPVAVPGAGVNSRFRYVPALKGFVMMARASANLYFIRTDAGEPNAVNQAPVARITASALSGTAPLTVQFNGTGSTDADGRIASYAWTFGDDGSATGATASRAYTKSGSYTAQLTVTDDRGLTNTTSVTITVQAVAVGPTMRVADIAMSWQNVTPWGTTAANAYVKLLDANGALVVGATVTANWSGLATANGHTAVTDARGIARFYSPPVRMSGTIVFAVTGVSKTGSTYTAAANTETTDSIRR